MVAQAVTKRTTEPPARLINREISWLDSSERLLDLAEDESVPLLERVKFCGLFSMILDEFFMVRVAGLVGQAETGMDVRSADGMTPRQALGTIRERVNRLTGRQAKLWRRELRPALAAHGIEVSPVDACSTKELARLQDVFERDIYPVLTPLGVGPGQPFPYISGLSLSLAVLAANPDTGEERFARVKVPEGLDRFVSTGSRLVPLESVISHFLAYLFPGMEIVERAAFRVTRNADFELSDDADDLLEAVESELRRRRFGKVVRLEVSASASRAMVARLLDGLDAEPDDVFALDEPLDLADLLELAQIERPELKDEPWIPVTPPRVARVSSPGELFAEIDRADLLTHQPYDSFRATFDQFAQSAANDPDVIAMKTTVYRTSDDSALVSALIDCAEQGKQSVCLVELKARFDERRNIETARAMEQAGVHVVHGFPDLKIHAKMTLVVRREPDGLRRYVHIGTGNYNAATARLYEDLGLFTADEEIAADVADLFNYLTGFGRPQRFRKLVVAPFAMRAKLIEEIRRVTAAAAAGERTRIRLKLNQLVDPAIIDELYLASQQGVPVDICARAICMLRAGVPGLSETIRVRSIFGRFLEHSRIYTFETESRTTMLMGSADLMPRNLDRRIEVLVPLDAARVRQEVTAILDSVFADDANAWELRADDGWGRIHPAKPGRPSVHQLAMQRRASKRVARGEGPHRGR